MMPLIRNLIPSDGPEVCRLSFQLGYASTVAETRERLAEISQSADSLLVGAFDETQIAGWMHVFYAVRIESAPFCEISGLIVDERYRGRGIGKLLLDRAKDWAEQKDAALRVRSNLKRTGAHRFYRREQFNEIKEQKVFVWEASLLPRIAGAR